LIQIFTLLIPIVLFSFVLEFWGVDWNGMTEDTGPDYFHERRKRDQKRRENMSVSVGVGTDDTGPL
jgi:hypothetical protein